MWVINYAWAFWKRSAFLFNSTRTFWEGQYSYSRCFFLRMPILYRPPCLHGNRSMLIAHPHPGLHAHSLWTSARGGALWAAVSCSSRTLTTPWVVAMAVLHPQYNYPKVYWQCTSVHRIKKSHFSINHSSQVVAKASVLRSLGYKATMAIIHH